MFDVLEEKEDIPHAYLCPITYCIMKDPVVAADGHTYERQAIEEWFNHHKLSSPMTGIELQSRHLVPNLTLKSMIREDPVWFRMSMVDVTEEEIKNAIQGRIRALISKEAQFSGMVPRYVLRMLNLEERRVELSRARAANTINLYKKHQDIRRLLNVPRKDWVGGAEAKRAKIQDNVEQLIPVIQAIDSQRKEMVQCRRFQHNETREVLPVLKGRYKETKASFFQAPLLTLQQQRINQKKLFTACQEDTFNEVKLFLRTRQALVSIPSDDGQYVLGTTIYWHNVKSLRVILKQYANNTLLLFNALSHIEKTGRVNGSLFYKLPHWNELTFGDLEQLYRRAPNGYFQMSREFSRKWKIKSVHLIPENEEKVRVVFHSDRYNAGRPLMIDVFKEYHVGRLTPRDWDDWESEFESISGINRLYYSRHLKFQYNCFVERREHINSMVCEFLGINLNQIELSPPDSGVSFRRRCLLL